MTEWYPIYSIVFNRPQMTWLILHLAELRQGQYPPNPVGTGYTDPAITVKRYREPAQNRVLELAAEVECRLELVMSYISGWDRPTKRIKRRYRR